MNQTDFETHCEAVVMLHVIKAREVWPQLVFPFPPILYDLRGVVAGQAHYKNKRASHIRLNYPLLSEQSNSAIEQTVVHELAHLIVRELCTQKLPMFKFQHPKPHGWEWQMVMANLGKQPKRTHNYNVAAHRQKRRTHKFRYYCRCGQIHVVGKKLHTNCQNGWKEYTCRGCGEDLRNLGFHDLGMV